MNDVVLSEDAVWAKVLEVVSQVSNLNKFYKIPRKELNAVMRKFNSYTSSDLGKIFKFVQEGKSSEANQLLAQLPEERVFAMLLVLGRSMKCWIESEGQMPQGKIRRWKVANA